MKRAISSRGAISKIAQEENEEAEKSEESDESMVSGGSLEEYLGDLLAALRAQYINYQTSHWIAKGDCFYSEHLMFQRLYGSVTDQIDTLAEKLICFKDEPSVDMCSQTEKIHLLCKKWADIDCPLERGLESEKFVQKLIEEAYEEITKSKEMTLGLDDFLMATANSHEENMYLLKRSLKKIK